MKTCTECYTSLPLTGFYKSRRSPDGVGYRCKTCDRKRSAAYVLKHKDRLREYERNRRREQTPARRRNQSLKLRYGITLDDFNRLAEAQGGVCKICGKVSIGNCPLVVDHCHRTKRVRGLLCEKCNVSIGRLGDTVEALEKVVAYLKGN